MVLGRVAAPHGVKGWIKLQVFGETVEALLQHRQWWLGRAKQWSAFVVSEGRVHGNTALACLEGIHTREAAASLKGLDVAVPRERLPAVAQGEYYWTDLEGMEVANREGQVLGKVEAVFSNGAQSVLVVRGGGQKAELLIPFVTAYVEGVDAAARRIRVDWQPEWS